LPICQAISHGANFSVDRVRPEIREPHAIVQQLRGGNQRIVWRHRLRCIFHVEIGAEHYFVAITIERGVKRRIAVVGRAENQVEHDEARAGREQSIE